MATAAVLRQRVFDNLYSAGAQQERPAVGRINGTFNSSVELITVDSGTPFNIGQVIENQATGEQMYVFSKATNDLGVYRGWNGTTAAAIADNSFLFINPKWSMKKIDDALTNTLRDLAAQGIYLLGEGTDLTLVAGQDVYEVTETDLDEAKMVLSVYYQDDANAELVGVPFVNLFEPAEEILTTSFGVRLLDWGNNAAGDTLQLIYAKKLDALADTDSEPLLESALVLGATAEALASQEGPRIHDPGRFTDRTVQPGQPLRDSAYFAGQYQRTVWRYRAFLQTKERNLPGARHRRVRRFRP